MIPYEDLVAALSSWRARQGLPVSTLAGTGEVPAAATRSMPPGPPPRAMPPGPPPRGASPPPLAPPDDPLLVDDAALLDEAQYEGEAADYAFGEEGGQTSVGGPPDRPSETSTPTGRSNKRNDW